MERDNYLDINYSIRFKKVLLEDTKVLTASFKNLRTEVFEIKKSNLYNYLIDIKDTKDVNEFLDINKHNFNYDLFISTYSEIDSYIFEIPSCIRRLISETNCSICISSTFLDPNDN